LSGALSDGRNGVKAGLRLSVEILAIGTFVAVLQPEPFRSSRAAQMALSYY
jgi:hypothetical protein